MITNSLTAVNSFYVIEFTYETSLLTAGEDYFPAWIDLTFSAENPEQNITVHVINDLISEADEIFSVVVNSSDDNCVAGRPARVTITDSDSKIKKTLFVNYKCDTVALLMLLQFADNNYK